MTEELKPIVNKLYEALRAREVGVKPARNSGSIFVREEVEDFKPIPTNIIYRVEAVFYREVVCPKDRAEWAIQDVKRGIVRDVFNPFRDAFTALRMAAYSDDQEAVLRIANEIEKAMFP